MVSMIGEGLLDIVEADSIKTNGRPGTDSGSGWKASEISIPRGTAQFVLHLGTCNADGEIGNIVVLIVNRLRGVVWFSA